MIVLFVICDHAHETFDLLMLDDDEYGECDVDADVSTGGETQSFSLSNSSISEELANGL